MEKIVNQEVEKTAISQKNKVESMPLVELRLNKYLLRKLNVQAIKENVNPFVLIRKALTEYLDKPEQK